MSSQMSANFQHDEFDKQYQLLRGRSSPTRYLGRQTLPLSRQELLEHPNDHVQQHVPLPDMDLNQYNYNRFPRMQSRSRDPLGSFRGEIPRASTMSSYKQGSTQHMFSPGPDNAQSMDKSHAQYQSQMGFDMPQRHYSFDRAVAQDLFNPTPLSKQRRMSYRSPTATMQDSSLIPWSLDQPIQESTQPHREDEDQIKPKREEPAKDSPSGSFSGRLETFNLPRRKSARACAEVLATIDPDSDELDLDGAAPKSRCAKGKDNKQASYSQRSHEPSPAIVQAREKKRIAQKRFRERQKAKQNDVMQRLHELEQQLQQQQSQNQALDQELSLTKHYMKPHMQGPNASFTQTSPTVTLSTSSFDQWQLDYKRIIELSQEQMFGIFKAYATDWTSTLTKLKDDKKCSKMFSRGKLEKTVQQFRTLLTNQMLCHPKGAWELAQIHFNPYSTISLEDCTAKITNALKECNLSDDQMQAIVNARVDFNTQIEVIFSEREQILSCFRATRYPQQPLDTNALVSQIHTASVLDTLSSNLAKETEQHFKLRKLVLDNTISALQYADLLTNTFPFFPDVLLLTSIVQKSAKKTEQTGIKMNDVAAQMQP